MASKNPLILKDFLLVLKYFSHRKSIRYNTEVNDLRVIICLRKSKVPVDKIFVCNVTEKLMEHGIHCLLCSYTSDDINMISY